MGQTQCGYDFPRSRGKLVSRMERLGARSKTAYRESGTNRFKPSPTTPGSSRNRPYDRPAFATDFTCPRSAFYQDLCGHTEELRVKILPELLQMRSLSEGSE